MTTYFMPRYLSDGGSLNVRDAVARLNEVSAFEVETLENITAECMRVGCDANLTDENSRDCGRVFSDGSVTLR